MAPLLVDADLRSAYIDDIWFIMAGSPMPESAPTGSGRVRAHSRISASPASGRYHCRSSKPCVAGKPWRPLPLMHGLHGMALDERAGLVPVGVEFAVH